MGGYNYKLSIIIPMYNAEKYIANCLNSILCSDLLEREYEVIIVNDGSHDNGPNIAQDFCTKHKNFRYLTQENKGQSVARNYGIEEAHGEYLWFVDSDDKIDNRINALLVKIEELGKPDVFSFYLQYISEEGKFLTKAFRFPGVYNLLMKGRDAIVSGYQPSSVCVFFMKKKFIDDLKLRFYPGIYHQDSEFSYRMMAYAKSVFFSDYVPYIYIKHKNTVVTSTLPEKVEKRLMDDITIIKSFEDLSKEFKETDLTLYKTIKKHCDGMLLGIVYSLYKNKEGLYNARIAQNVLTRLEAEHLYPMKIGLKPIKRNLLKLFLNNKKMIY